MLSIRFLYASYRVDSGPREYRFEYGLEANDRKNTETESFSPTRHRLRLRYFHQLGASAEVGGSLEFRDSDYKGVSGDDRHDQRSRVRLEYKLPVRPHLGRPVRN